jgi:hypothetical protein
MATINTDIAQKIDITARQYDSMTITLNMSTSSNAVYPLASTYILFVVYNVETEGSLLFLSNHDNGYPTGGSLANVVTLYDKFTTDTYTVEDKDAININTTTGVITINQLQLNIAPGGYKYKLILQTTTSIKTWMYGKFKVNE